MCILVRCTEYFALVNMYKQSLVLVDRKHEKSRDKYNQLCARPVYWKKFLMLREIKEELNKSRDKSCSWKGTVNVVKVSILSKFICRSPAFVVIVEIYKLNLKCFWKYKGPEMTFEKR